jgi:hypothetical protein
VGNPTLRPRGVVSARADQRRIPGRAARVFLTRSFYLPFLAVTALCFWLAQGVPQRYQARLLLSIPIARTGELEEVSAGSPQRRETDSLRLFFRAPGRIESALARIEGQDPGLHRDDRSQLAARLARQTQVRVADDSATDRILVEVRTWSMERPYPSAILRTLGEDLLDLQERWSSGEVPARLDQIRARKVAQKVAVERTRSEIRDFLASRLPAGTDLDLAVEESLRSGASALHDLLEPDDGGTTTPDAASLQGSDEGQDDGENGQRSDPESRYGFRKLRQRYQQETEILQEIESQEKGISSRLEALQAEEQRPEILEWPARDPERVPPNPLFVLLICCSIGGAAGSLVLLIRLLGSEIRSRPAPRPEPVAPE